MASLLVSILIKIMFVFSGQMRFIIAFALINFVVHSGQNACPPNFVDVGDQQCMIQMRKSTHFCDGHKLCQNLGTGLGVNAFMVGRHLNKLNQVTTTALVHTGAHGLLVRPGSSVLGWRVSDPGDDGTFNVNYQNWQANEPNGDTDGIIEYDKGSLNDAPQDNVKRDTVCEISQKPPNDSTISTEFRRNDHANLILPSLFGDSSRSIGCFTNFTTASLIECAMK